jgi:hypothetical protein
MSIYRIVNMGNFSSGKFGRLPDPPEPQERDCENCRHYVKQNEGNTEALFGELYGCEKWSCEFEPKEENEE